MDDLARWILPLFSALFMTVIIAATLIKLAVSYRKAKKQKDLS